MKRNLLDVRFFSTAIILVLFVLFQFLFQTTYSLAGMCNSSLLDFTKPLQSYPAYTGTFFGFPLTFISVIRDGCSDDSTKTEWNFPSLLIDIFVIGFTGALPYEISWLSKRLKHRKTK
ncbi:MAG: hypothetical protein ACK40V_06800 [Anaerolineales bacterium]